MIEQDFLDKMPDNLIDGFNYINNSFIPFYNKKNEAQRIQVYIGIIEYYNLLKAFLKKHDFETEGAEPRLGEDLGKNIKSVFSFFEIINSGIKVIDREETIEKSKERFELFFNNQFAYEFTTGDFKKIQSLINELRDLITASELFEEDHKRRLLIKLENLQKTLHKKVSNLDMIYGLIGETGVVLGKFGNDAKPFVDMIKEIVNIGYRTQARAEELESNSKLPGLDILKELGE